MRRLSSSAGLTIVEVAIASTLLVGILAGANAIITTGTGVAQSTANVGAASNRADRALQTLGDALRRGSVASALRLNGTYFSDGASDSGFKIREVRDFSGVASLDSVSTYRFDLPAGQIEGSILHSRDGVDRVIASGVASFSVSRAGNLFTLSIHTRSGPSDDRLRSIRASLQVAARNP